MRVARVKARLTISRPRRPAKQRRVMGAEKAIDLAAMRTEHASMILLELRVKFYLI